MRSLRILFALAVFWGCYYSFTRPVYSAHTATHKLNILRVATSLSESKMSEKDLIRDNERFIEYLESKTGLPVEFAVYPNQYRVIQDLIEGRNHLAITTVDALYPVKEKVVPLAFSWKEAFQIYFAVEAGKETLKSPVWAKDVKIDRVMMGANTNALLYDATINPVPAKFFSNMVKEDGTYSIRFVEDWGKWYKYSQEEKSDKLVMIDGYTANFDLGCPRGRRNPRIITSWGEQMNVVAVALIPGAVFATSKIFQEKHAEVMRIMANTLNQYEAEVNIVVSMWDKEKKLSEEIPYVTYSDWSLARKIEAVPPSQYDVWLDSIAILKEFDFSIFVKELMKKYRTPHKDE